jgi:exosortase A
VNNLCSREAWRIAVGILAALMLLLYLLYQQTFTYLLSLWNQLEAGEYGHGYLVLLISGYLIFYNRRKLMALTPCPEYRPVLAILAASMLWTAAALVNIEVLQAASQLFIVMSVMWALLGSGVMRVLLLPMLYIGFAIPVWFPLSPLLQELTADVVFWVIRLIDIPALRIENVIVLPAGRLSIEEACSGLRYFLAALTLGTLFAYLNYTSFTARLMVLLVSASAAILANILRVLIVVYLGYTTDMQHPLVSDHLTFGWYLFGGVVAILLIVDWLVYKARSHAANEVPNAAIYKQQACSQGKSHFIVAGFLCVLCISTGPAIIIWKNNQSQHGGYSLQAKTLSKIAEWSVVDGKADYWEPHYEGAIDHKMMFQDENNHEVYLYLGLYLEQSQGKELINYSNRISDNNVWYTSNNKVKQHDIDGKLVLEQLLEKKDGSRRLVWYWYHVAGRDATNKYEAKALQILGFFQGKQQASVVAIATEVDGELEYARETLDRFIVDTASKLTRVIDYNK